VTDSVYLMMYCFIGGLAHPLGAVVGAFTLVLGFELLGAAGRYQSILFAAAMIAAMVLLPNGLVGGWWAGRRRSSLVDDAGPAPLPPSRPVL